MVHSDLLIFMTDIDGLYTANPHTNKQAQHIPVVNEITDEIEKLAGDTDNNNATGGMITKIYGAKLATAAGVPVFICRSADENVLVNAVNGQARGTLFTAKDSALKTRLQWMALYAESKGNIYIDAGAAKAVEEMGKSLLPSGIVAIEGDFLKGDVVSVYSQGDHRYIGKGIVNYNKKDVYALMGKHSSDLAFGNKKKPEIIHHDNWISEKHFR